MLLIIVSYLLALSTRSLALKSASLEHAGHVLMESWHLSHYMLYGGKTSISFFCGVEIFHSEPVIDLTANHTSSVKEV